MDDGEPGRETENPPAKDWGLFPDIPPEGFFRRILYRREFRGDAMPGGITVAERLAEIVVERAMAGSIEHLHIILKKLDEPPFYGVYQ